MSISRIGEVQAKPELTGDLRDFLISIMPIIKSSEGCESVQLYQSQDDRTKFIMTEVWDSVDSHLASVKNIPPKKLAEIRPLLASPPSGIYYDLVRQTIKERIPRTNKELCTTTDRLFYEWQMLTNSAQELQTVTNKLLENAFIESCAVHSRALVKFLYSSKSRPTDAIAEDFFVNPDIWINACPTIPKELTYENFVKFANKQIAHIVYSADENKHIWNFTAITDALQPILEEFIELVKANQLGDRWLSQLENQTGARWEKLKILVNSKINLTA